MRIHTREIVTTCSTDCSIAKYGIVLLRCNEKRKQVSREVISLLRIHIGHLMLRV